MKNSVRTGCFILALAVGLAGCDSASRPPITLPMPPTPIPPAPTTGVQLAGTVSDVLYRPLGGARVEVVDGPHAGLSTMTGVDGRFGLSGEFNETTHFRATKDGHVAATRAFPARCGNCNPNWWIHFNLGTGASRADLAGDYTMTFIADTACRGLPDDARTATYEASLTLQSGPNVPANSWYTATIGGTTPLNSNSFWVGLDGDQFLASMGDAHGLAAPVWELAPRTYLSFADGEAAATVTDASSISAVFTATVARCEVATVWGGRRNCESGESITRHQCQSGNHRLIFERR